MIHGVPEQARSLALVLEILDAPAGSECHWVLWNIPPQTSEIREHVLPFPYRGRDQQPEKNGLQRSVSSFRNPALRLPPLRPGPETGTSPGGGA
ncbi:hypothetical protein JFN93_14815 [Geomonas sp. Red875]|uniref:Uncharacterized protein n=1 Tax=Geomesophilobacter sediminis TaxID=2798584 RepID=A0A8J7J0B7_9BACT|nr:hypothetical protein [Geomesophilobacter sediminis]